MSSITQLDEQAESGQVDESALEATQPIRMPGYMFEGYFYKD